MTLFFIKRFYHAVCQHRLWFLLSMLPVLVYLLVTAMRPDRFMISQDIRVQSGAPVALASSPVEFTKIDEFVSYPFEFLLDNFALRKLSRLFYGKMFNAETGEGLKALVKTVENTMTLKRTSSECIRVIYYGKDLKTGKKLVGFYVERMVENIKAGQKRRAIANLDKNSKSAGVAAPAQVTTELKGEIKVDARQVIFRSERIMPAVVLVFAGFFVVLFLVLLVECLDPSFKSERQISRYLGVPTLGSLPDLYSISNKIQAGQQK